MPIIKINHQQKIYLFLILSTAVISSLIVIITMASVRSQYSNSVQVVFKGNLNLNSIGNNDNFGRYPKLIEDDGSSKIKVDRQLLSYLLGNYRNAKYSGFETYRKYSVARLRLKPLTNVIPLRSNMGPVYTDINLKFLINTTPCSSKTGQSSKPSVFVAVTSNAGETGRRDIIRRTWMKSLKKKEIVSGIELAGFAFVVGKSNSSYIQSLINEEIQNNGDIIQVDTHDAFNDSTRKSIALLGWIVQYCPQVHYLMKVNDDVFVNVRNLAATIQTFYPDDLTFYGTVNENGKKSDQEKKSISTDDWPWENFPLHVDGSFYLLSRTAIYPLLAAVQGTPHFQLEDVYLSGICNRRIGVSIRSSPRMVIQDFSFNIIHDDACFAKRNVSWVINDPLNQMLELHQSTEQFYENVPAIECKTDAKPIIDLTANETTAIPQTFPNHPIPVQLKIVYKLD